MSKSTLSPAIRTALSELRWRIRAYVVADALALAAVWIGLTFWIGLAIDYLPVLTWASEVPRVVRAGGLVVVAGVLAWIVYNYLIRRLFVRLRDRSMALLVERKFKGFSDELVTAVELSEDRDRDEPFDQEMLDRTKNVATEQVRRLRLADIFNPKPLARNAILAILLLAPIAPFALLKPNAVKTWFQRFYMLQDISWPRDTMVQVIGFQPQRSASAAAKADAPLEPRPFNDSRSMKIARGSSGTLRIKAKSRSGEEPPQYCTIYYRSADGARSSVRMNKFQRPTKDGYQVYTLASKPFKGVLGNLVFDVVANDSRLSGFQLDVVDSPELLRPTLECTFPDYLVDEESSSWLPREMPYVPSGTSLPIGTKVKVRLKSNKPIREATVRFGDEGSPQPLNVVGPSELVIDMPPLEATTTMYLMATDSDGVEMERPEKYVIGAVKDNPPELNVLHPGIGSMVTPDVMFPIQGTATDDYRIDRVWFELVTPDGRVHNFSDVSIDKKGELSGGLDMRAKRAAEEKENAVELKPGDKISVTTMAADRFNLEDSENIGLGIRMDLEVVTPARLLTALDQRELAQRRMFEHVIEEMAATRDDLSRVERALTDGDMPDVDPGEEVDLEQLKRRAAALRLLRIQQASLQSEKSTQETAGIAAAFEDIVLELKNNRVDSQDRQGRLTSKVAEPLALIAETMFPELDNRLNALEEAVGANAEDSAALAKQTLEQVDDVLAEMEKVLQEMQDIEEFNEIVEMFRLILEESVKIKQETERERAKGLKGILE